MSYVYEFYIHLIKKLRLLLMLGQVAPCFFSTWAGKIMFNCSPAAALHGSRTCVCECVWMGVCGGLGSLDRGRTVRWDTDGVLGVWWAWPTVAPPPRGVSASLAVGEERQAASAVLTAGKRFEMRSGLIFYSPPLLPFQSPDLQTV